MEVIKASATVKPAYEHDCDKCTFLGRATLVQLGVGRVYDMYHCTIQGPNDHTLIVRYSSNGSDYSSGYEFTRHNHVLAEAKKLADAQGLFSTQEEQDEFLKKPVRPRLGYYAIVMSDGSIKRDTKQHVISDDDLDDSILTIERVGEEGDYHLKVTKNLGHLGWVITQKPYFCRTSGRIGPSEAGDLVRQAMNIVWKEV